MKLLLSILFCAFIALPSYGQSTSAWYLVKNTGTTGTVDLTTATVQISGNDATNIVTAGGGGTGGGVPEAPNDGNQYGRQSLQWTVVNTNSYFQIGNNGMITLKSILVADVYFTTNASGQVKLK